MGQHAAGRTRAGEWRILGPVQRQGWSSSRARGGLGHESGITYEGGRPRMGLPLERTIVCPVLIGRAPYLSALESALAQARGGAGRTLLLAGEAGIGKTR